ncbi:hypothetical protein [Streptosporangium sp. NPDC048865]|uniref:hypothetical protein n=1 Tax=Streptosporangium sp. NPDC048865 TaxID=3155766 RepID=UPI0034178461
MTALTLPAPQQLQSGPKSSDAARMLDDLMALPPESRRLLLAGLSPRELTLIFSESFRERGTPYAVWEDDPEGFVEQVLGASLWSTPRKFMRALVDNQTVAVPSCFGSSKSFSAAQLTLWFSLVHPVGQTRVITLAPLWRQVSQQLWLEIRGAHSRAALPGTIDTAQYKLPNASGQDILVANGIAAAPHNEAAVQGIHAAHLLLVVEEAGGIAHTIGNNLRGLLVGDHSRMLAIGNPPTDEQGTWFEGLCKDSETVLIPISAYDTPNLTGEDFGECKSCPGGGHSPAKHMVDEKWIAGTIRTHGAKSNYVRAKVHAKFPTGTANAAIPSDWVDIAAARDEPAVGTRLDGLGLADETAEWKVPAQAWVRLGVDVAEAGGDELVIARCVHDLVTVEHVSSGPENAKAVDVAGKILAEIKRADRLRRRLGTTARVRVKVDGIGVGWGVADLLRQWGEDGVHDAEIVRVVVSENTDREPDAATMRPRRKRDEMWLAGRALVQPNAAGNSALRLRVDDKTKAQLGAPKLTTDSAGFAVVETKKSMKGRGVDSPDRAEAALLSVYEPAERKVSQVIQLIV